MSLAHISNFSFSERQDTGKAPNFVESLAPLSVSQGQKAQFKVTIEGDPQPSITWFKVSLQYSIAYIIESIINVDIQDGRGIVADKRVSLAVDGTTHTLTMAESFPQDSGVYEVVAKNTRGENRSKANLNVASKPFAQAHLILI